MLSFDITNIWKFHRDKTCYDKVIALDITDVRTSGQAGDLKYLHLPGFLFSNAYKHSLHSQHISVQ